MNFTRVSGKVSAKFDLAQAYQQLVFNDGIPDTQTIIIHPGNCQATFLHLGISVAFGVFHCFVKLWFLEFLMAYYISVLWDYEGGGRGTKLTF
jgi:hypothetical protein